MPRSKRHSAERRLCEDRYLEGGTDYRWVVLDARNGSVDSYATKAKAIEAAHIFDQMAVIEELDEDTQEEQISALIEREDRLHH